MAKHKQKPEGREMEKQEWITKRIALIEELSSKTPQQELLLELHKKQDRNKRDEAEYQLLVRAERVTEKAATMIAVRQADARKKRTHNLIQAAGLLALAGLLDNETGELVGLDAATLVGAALSIRATCSDEAKAPHVESWKRRGQEKLTAMEQKAKEEREKKKATRTALKARQTAKTAQTTSEPVETQRTAVSVQSSGINT